VYSCIDSIANACVSIPYEIIVSSNSAYLPDKCDSLKEKFPYIKWVFNKTNKGFASGMNSGILSSTGKVIIIMNPDVQISKADMRKAFDYLTSHQKVGLIGPRIVDRQGRIQDSCRRFMTPKEFLSRLSARLFHGKDVLLEPSFDYCAVQPVDWVIGAFMMLRRDALYKVGLLDENYFLYVEDMDWCKRFWDCGFQVVYYPLIEAIYKGDRKSVSVLILKKLFNKYALYHLKSYLLFLSKNRFHISRNQKISSEH
jgi:GT2 family glycosyltransferase